MKKILLTLMLGCLTATCLLAQDPVVMTIDGKDILQSDFDYLWRKNNQGVADSTSVEDYADLFVLFKLKVAEAEAAGLDTMKSFVDELNGYRSQLTPRYLTDLQTEEALYREAYEMMQYYVEMSHILIAVDASAQPADTLNAYRQIMDIREQLLAGADFATMARTYSADNNRNEGGYLGVTIASRYIYSFAKVAMQLQEGELSQPVRSPFGYHLIKLYKREKALGQYVSGHIFKAVQQHAPEEARQKAEADIRRIYDALQNGEDFAHLADLDNDDSYVVGRGGQYQLLRPGTLPYDYERTIFSLQDGEYSKPFQSEFGWHIVKRFEVSTFPSLSQVREELKTSIQRDERVNAGKNALADRLLKEYHYQPNMEAIHRFKEKTQTWEVPDERLVDAVRACPVLARFDQTELTAEGFARFLMQGGQSLSYLEKALLAYARQEVLRYEDGLLEQKYPDFGRLMNEYHDGILLFEISNREVWEKASNDVKGLERFFRTHRRDYAWEQPRYKGYVVYCRDDSRQKEIRQLLKKLPQDSVSVVLDRLYNNDSITYVRTSYGLFAQGEQAIIDHLAFGEGEAQANKEFPCVFLQGKVLKRPEEVADVRGQVVADYQDYLERQWVARLRKQHTVQINQDVLHSIQP